MTLTFCQYSAGGDRKPVQIDPLAVVKLTLGTRPVPRSRTFTEHIGVLTVVLNDGTEHTLFDTTGAVAKRIIRERAAQTERAAPVAGSGPSPA
jgi:hypothetical protein